MGKALSILLSAALFAACAVFLWLAGEGSISAVEPPEVRPAPEPYVAVRDT
jgi:hypothetical protein